jgi:hypothetical protein
MPSSWLWYHRAVARWSFGYWKVAVPGAQVTPDPACASALHHQRIGPRASGMQARGKYPVLVGCLT